MEIEILQLLDGARQAKGLTVIIDVFRAFTTESMIMAYEPEKLLAVGDIQTALDYRAAHPDAVLCGERDGAIIPGFNYGNSPSQIEFANLAGKAVVHTTSAGTQGIVNATGADEILGGSLVNAKAIACYIQKKQPKHVSLVCMGLAGVCPTEEDTLCAEYIRSLLLGQPLEGDPAVISGESGAVPAGVVQGIMTEERLKTFRELLGMNEDSCVLVISTEGDTDRENYRKVMRGTYSL